MDVETFVHGRFDTEATRPLLEMLGVRHTPTGPDSILDIVRGLAHLDNPPAHEVEKWYRRLDQMIVACSVDDLDSIGKAFHDERIILTEDATWVNASGVFLSADEEDVPGAALIRSSVSDLALWRKIGIAERPTADLAIQWLKELPSGEVLSQGDSKRVQGLLSRHPERIWSECGHWLSLAGEWVPVAPLSCALTMQRLVHWSHLHAWAKRMTADFRHLPVEVTSAWPFSALPALADRVEERFHGDLLPSGSPKRAPWLNQVGIELCRIELSNTEEEARVRELSAALSKTAWQTTPGVETIPYIDGTPAGTPRSVEVLWLDNTLYVDDLLNGRLARLVPEKLASEFGLDFSTALSYCFGRTPEEVTEYLEENFKLVPRDTVEPLNDDGPAATSDNEGITSEEATAKLGISPAQPRTQDFEPDPEPRVGNGGDLGSGTSGKGPGGAEAGALGGGDARPGGQGHPGAAKGQPGDKGAAGGNGSWQFKSYLAVDPAEDEGDLDGLEHQERMDMEERAIALILDREPGLQRTPANNPGFDLFESGPDGNQTRWIEVKAMKSDLDNHPVGLSKTQFECAQEHREHYWLYIVEHAGSTDEAHIVPIRDPAGKARTFTFDSGWRSVAEISAANDTEQPEEDD